jgi:hypothetical protein
MAEEIVKKSSPLLVAVAWLLVLVPTGWGLTYTVQNALKIFTAGAAPAPAPAPVHVNTPH